MCMMKTDEVAKLLNCSPRTVQRIVDDGLLKQWRLRGLVRYRQEDVEALMDDFGFDPDDGSCQCDEGCECAKGRDHQ